MKLSIHAIETCTDILECISTHEISESAQKDVHLHALINMS